MSQPEHDREFEAFLQRRERLAHRLADLDREEPPPELDRIVLARAREAIQMPQPIRVFRPARWALAASLAVGLLLSCVVVLTLRLSSDLQETEAVAEIADAGAAKSRESLSKDAPLVAARNEPRPAHSPEADASVMALQTARAPEDPDVWLKRIDELRAQGRTADADREWRAFREAHPDHPRVLEPDPPPSR